MVESAAFNWVDYAIIGVVILSMVISLVRGFVREALSLATWISAIWIGIHFSGMASQWLEPYITASALRMVAAFFVLFALALLAGSILSFVLVQFIQKTGLSGTDRSLGVIFGLGRGFIIVAIGLLMGNMMFPPGSSGDEPSVFAQSRLAPEFSPIMNWLKEFLPQAPDPTKVMGGLSGLPGANI